MPSKIGQRNFKNSARNRAKRNRIRGERCDNIRRYFKESERKVAIAIGQLKRQRSKLQGANPSDPAIVRLDGEIAIQELLLDGFQARGRTQR